MNQYYVDRRMFTARGGWQTNCLGMALGTYLSLNKEEYAAMIKETRLMLRITIKCLSIKTVAQSFNVNYREIVRILRWAEGKRYRRPYQNLLREIHAELKEDFGIA
jgi:hypothetical protein